VNAPHVHDLLRQRLLEAAGIVELPVCHLPLEMVEQSEWSPEFERLRRARMVMGYYRYGGLTSPARRAKLQDNVGSAIARLQRYYRTGNQECLCDAANLCMVEFMVPSCHQDPSWQPVDDGQHARRK